MLGNVADFINLGSRDITFDKYSDGTQADGEPFLKLVEIEVDVRRTKFDGLWACWETRQDSFPKPLPTPRC